jgi:predicted enzyme related to lactoylglutathione lyase
MGRAVVHFELMSKDPVKVAGFYEKIFGWKVTHHPELNYRIVETGAGAASMAASSSRTSQSHGPAT